MKIQKDKYKALVKTARKASQLLHTVDSDEAQDLANELETAINESKAIKT